MKWAFAIGAFRVGRRIRNAIVACRRRNAAIDATERASSGREAVSTERDLRSVLVVTRDGVWRCPRRHRHRERCGRRSKSRQDYAGIKSVSRPSAVAKHVGATPINR
jgi:hypothetical protein